MYKIKRFVLRVVFTAEILIFSFFYVFGVNGLSALYRLQEDSRTLEDHIEAERNAINHLSQQIACWRTSSFYQEKIAREKLQMIKKDEIVYFIP